MGILEKVGLLDKADDQSNGSGNGNDSGEGSPNQPPRTSDSNDGSADRSAPRGLRLQFIGTPQLLKMAQNLFTLACGDDNEDHSRYAEYLLDLDGVLRKYGSKANLGGGGNSGGGESDDLNDADNWGD